jgi:hypothetical protein
MIVRPEAVRRIAAPGAAEFWVKGRVEEVVFLGSHVKYVLVLASGERLVAHDAAEAPRAALGSEMLAGWNTSAHRIIDDR